MTYTVHFRTDTYDVEKHGLYDYIDKYSNGRTVLEEKEFNSLKDAFSYAGEKIDCLQNKYGDAAKYDLEMSEGCSIFRVNNENTCIIAYFYITSLIFSNLYEEEEENE